MPTYTEITPRELKPLLATLERHPDLAVVVDHCAKPDVTRRSVTVRAS